MISCSIIVLYVWSSLFGEGLGSAFGHIISPVSVALASVAALLSALLYLWTPKKHLVIYSLTVYLFLAAATGYLVFETGGVYSPFIAIWMIVSVFSGVFGSLALLPMTAAVVGYGILHFTGTGEFEPETILAFLFAGALPIIVSHVMWHRQGEHEAGKDRAYRELANELSQVSGKSDVVINAIADGVVALDSQGTIELINPAAQQIIGWQRQDAVGLNYKSVLQLLTSSEKEPSPSEDPVSQALATNKPIRNDKLKLLTEAKKKLLVSIVVSPIGQVGSGVIIVFRDVTKEKAEERQQAEFISTASHEMRTPVASIEGYLGLALNPATASIDEKARDFITKAHESAQHLGRLFQDLLDVSKAEDGRLENDPSVVDVVEFAHGVVEGLRPKAAEKNLRLLYKPKPDDDPQPPSHSLSRGGISSKTLTPVYYANLDNDHLREVIANLVENAIKYTLQGDIVVDVTGDEDHITITVQDSGIGIPAEDIPHLFQKFYRVDSTATREIGGTGLGLYLCRRLAEAMSGRIWAESEFNRGSTFHLEIPRIGHEEAMALIEQTANAEQASAPRIGDVSQQSPLESLLLTQAGTLPPVAQQPTPQPTPQPVAPQPYSRPVQQQPQQISPIPVQVAATPIPTPQPQVPSQPLPQPQVPTPQPSMQQPQQPPQQQYQQPMPQPAPQPAAPPQPVILTPPPPAAQQYVPIARRQPENTPLSTIERKRGSYENYPQREIQNQRQG